VVGEAATDLYREAREMLDKVVAEKWFGAKGVIGFWPAQADGDDIVLYTDETRTTELSRLFTLRQQMDKSEGKANLALSDFVAPIGQGGDYMGGFAVTAGHGEDEIVKRSRTPATTTAPSWPRPWPTAWPKPSPSGCTTRPASSCGATRPTRTATPT
jgi:cobalamin-dependent methionine synthase I